MQFIQAYGEDLHSLPLLRDQMFADRRRQFMEQMGWDLQTDATGREMDEYDALNPLYVIVTDDDGKHAASMRVMPTTGRTMLAEKFPHLTSGLTIASEATWEITRFFVPRREDRRLAPALMWAGCETALRAGVSSYAGVVSTHMVRVFALFGAKAEILNRAQSPEGEICACIWEMSEALSAAFRKAARLDDSVRLPLPFRPTRKWNSASAAFQPHRIPASRLPFAAEPNCAAG